MIRQIEKARVVGEILALSADLSPSFSPRDFNALLNRYARQITAGNFAAFARFLGLNYRTLMEFRYGVNTRPTLDTLIKLIQRLGLSVKDFLGGKESEIELPDRREFHFARSNTSLAKELMHSAVMDPACPSLSELRAQIGYKSQGSLRRIDPELCREISARHREVRVNNPQANKRLYDRQTLRERLTAALDENPAPSLTQITKGLGYEDQVSLRNRCPDLYDALRERRQVYLKERKESLEMALKAALIEQPPPTIKAITTQLGMKNPCAIHYHFPQLARAITDRARTHREGCLERARLALESALTEVPPPSVPEVARNTNHGVAKLYSHFPDLCHQVATNYSEYRHQRSIVRKEEKRKFKMIRMN